MSYSSIIYSIEDRIATVTLNRPERRNALDDVMIRELTDAFGLLSRNTQSRIVVLTGSGSAFCAGMDLEYLQRYSQLSHEENLEDARRLLRLFRLIAGNKKPVIAMVNGPALGGGCGLTAVCDFVFAGREKARFGVPEVRLGFVPALILPYLIGKMGGARAREFTLRGDTLDAATAIDRGLVTDVFDDADLRRRVYEFAENFVRTTSPSSISLMKDLLARLHEMDTNDAFEYAANLNALARKTEDFQKGIGSFLNKEKLEW